MFVVCQYEKRERGKNGIYVNTRIVASEDYHDVWYVGSRVLTFLATRTNTDRHAYTRKAVSRQLFMTTSFSSAETGQTFVQSDAINNVLSILTGVLNVV